MALKKAEAPLEVQKLDQKEFTIQLVGRTPLYFNKMSAKAQRTLLLGGGKKTAAEKKQQKHSPMDEFRASAYTHKHEDTLLCFPAPGIKGAMATAALETAGVTKSSVQRLIYLPEQHVRIWGIPQLKMDVVRSADMNKTPDIRTRAFLPHWCAEVTVRYISPTMTEVSVISLLQNAGMVVGIGDFRIEKGKGSFGAFAITTTGHPLMPEFEAIRADGGRDAQQLAMDAPEFADEDTLELWEMWSEDDRERKMSVAA